MNFLGSHFAWVALVTLRLVPLHHKKKPASSNFPVFFSVAWVRPIDDICLRFEFFCSGMQLGRHWTGKPIFAWVDDSGDIFAWVFSCDGFLGAVKKWRWEDNKGDLWCVKDAISQIYRTHRCFYRWTGVPVCPCFTYIYYGCYKGSNISKCNFKKWIYVDLNYYLSFCWIQNGDRKKGFPLPKIRPFDDRRLWRPKPV